jgi:hypothetical protein
MGVQAYTIAVGFMGGLGGLAAVGAVTLAILQLRRPRSAVRRPAFAFDLPVASPVLLRESQAQGEDAAPPVPPPPPAPPPPRLELALMSPRAPMRLRVPVDLARGRILELSLPLWISAAGSCDLPELTIRIVLPNEITYGASLDHLAREPIPGLTDARVAYASSENQTTITIEVPLLEGGAEANIPVPVSIKHAGAGAYPIAATASCPALGTIERSYELELVDASAPVSNEIGTLGWTCRPDESSRVRDPDLPLDRIVSTAFVVTETDEEDEQEAHQEPDEAAAHEAASSEPPSLEAAEAEPDLSEPAQSDPPEAEPPEAEPSEHEPVSHEI